MTLLLVRHAHAGDRKTWKGDDLQRPVSQLGAAQSRGLIGLLGDRRVTRILSSQAARATQTVDPLGAHLGCPVEVDEILWETTSPEAAWTWMCTLASEADDSDVVLCSHGDLIGPLIELLRDRGAPIPDDARWQKGSTWELRTVGDTVTDATYHPPIEA